MMRPAESWAVECDLDTDYPYVDGTAFIRAIQSDAYAAGWAAAIAAAATVCCQSDSFGTFGRASGGMALDGAATRILSLKPPGNGGET